MFLCRWEETHVRIRGHLIGIYYLHIIRSDMKHEFNDLSIIIVL